MSLLWEGRGRVETTWTSYFSFPFPRWRPTTEVKPKRDDGSMTLLFFMPSFGVYLVKKGDKTRSQWNHQKSTES